MAKYLKDIRIINNDIYEKYTNVFHDIIKKKINNNMYLYKGTLTTVQEDKVYDVDPIITSRKISIKARNLTQVKKKLLKEI